MATASLRRSSSRFERSAAIRPEATKRRRTEKVPRTESGRLLPKGVAIKVSEALENYSEGDVATALETTKDTAQSWKLARRAANSAYLLGLGKAFDEVGMLMAEEADLGRFYGHEGRAMEILKRKSLLETPEGQLARSMLREIMGN